ncbi:hypothetical protein ACSBR1_005655 [Camellia fascicularis]
MLQLKNGKQEVQIHWLGLWSVLLSVERLLLDIAERVVCQRKSTQLNFIGLEPKTVDIYIPFFGVSFIGIACGCCNYL